MVYLEHDIDNYIDSTDFAILLLDLLSVLNPYVPLLLKGIILKYWASGTSLLMEISP
jgi:hypothetical protein